MRSIIDIAVFSARISPKTVWTFVRARDSEGREGWGEATLAGQAAAVEAHVERLAHQRIGSPVITGTTTPDTESMAQAAAISAVDQAMWDLHAQAQSKTLAEALGAPRRTTIELYANINRGTTDRSPHAFALRALDAANRGFDAIKIAPFDDVTPEIAESAAGRHAIAAGVERVAAVRAAIGPQRALLVDCHWRFTESAARDVLRELEPLQLYWFECPLPEMPTMLPALRRLRSQANAAGVQLAGCESMTGLAHFESFLDAGVYDVIMPDVKYAGGLAEMLRIAEAAEVRGAVCSPHNPSGPIAHLHSVHVSAVLPTIPFLEFQYGESPLFFDIVDGVMPDPNGGRSALPSGPGLGVALDVAKLGELRANAISGVVA